MDNPIDYINTEFYFNDKLRIDKVSNIPFNQIKIRIKKFLVWNQIGSCVLWSGYCDEFSNPSIKISGKNFTVRCLLYKLYIDNPIGHIFSTCGTETCVNPYHCEDRSKQVVQLWLEGKYYPEITEITGLSKRWIQSKIKKARKEGLIND